MNKSVPPSYLKLLREAQGLFRANEQSRAFEIAQDLRTRFPDAQDIGIFYDAAAKYINVMVHKNRREENHALTIYYAEMLIDNPTHGDFARTALLEASRAGLIPQERVDLLHPVCKDATELTQYWHEIASCLPDLPANDKTIDLGFDTLEQLPGHDVALAALAQLIARQNDADPAPHPSGKQ
jgi:hypothetical protein